MAITHIVFKGTEVEILGGPYGWSSYDVASHVDWEAELTRVLDMYYENDQFEQYTLQEFINKLGFRDPPTP